MPAPLAPVTLTGRHVRLEPLSLDHVDGLAAAAAVDRSTYGLAPVPDGVDGARAFVQTALAGHAAGLFLPFAQIDVTTDRVVGSTRYLDLQYWTGSSTPNAVEIGSTWLAADAQRTGINTDAKFLLLQYAFDELGVWRVQICTDARNARSRTAIERIGATFEGILRNFRVASDSGGPRQTAVFSVVADEWPSVRDRLAARR
jgi:RimJ/RimL family protein N-acetyltransferase